MTVSNVLTSGTVQKAPGDRVRLQMDFGDEPTLVDGAAVVDGELVLANNIASFDINASGLSVSSKQLDYAYQASGVFSGGTSGTRYAAVFTITLDDPDSTAISRTGIIAVV